MQIKSSTQKNHVKKKTRKETEMSTKKKQRFENIPENEQKQKCTPKKHKIETTSSFSRLPSVSSPPDSSSLCLQFVVFNFDFKNLFVVVCYAYVCVLLHIVARYMYIIKWLSFSLIGWRFDSPATKKTFLYVYKETKKKNEKQQQRMFCVHSIYCVALIFSSFFYFNKHFTSITSVNNHNMLLY